MTVQQGSVLAGKYRVERVLGEGGMGVVVAATHLQLDKRVALKFLRPEVLQKRDLVARFLNEGRAASKIQSEHVAKVLDVGTLDDGAPYMVMEYLEGGDLAQVIRKRGPLPGQEAIEYLLQACEALAEAHVAGIVHRDLKPANLFLTARADGSPCIKVLDFGISKAALSGHGDQALTQTSAVLGSPNYMAPEQLRSARQVDARSDIWALGVTLQELLTGEVSFKADTLAELHVSILQSSPKPLRARRPEAPPAMEAIIFRCLEKDPARRFSNVGELAAALAEFAPPRARLSVERIGRIVGAAGGARHSVTGAPMQAGQALAPTMAATMGSTGGGPAVQPTGYGYATPANTGYGTPAPGYTPPGTPPGYTRGPGQPNPAAMVGPQPDGRFGRQPSVYGQQAQAQPPRQGMHPSTIALIAIVAVLVLGIGGCTFCMCLGAAAGGGGGRRSDALPFQRPAGWTTLSAGAAGSPNEGPDRERAPSELTIDPLVDFGWRAARARGTSRA